jgi:DNA sulfur modification protein DndC
MVSGQSKHHKRLTQNLFTPQGQIQPCLLALVCPFLRRKPMVNLHSDMNIIPSLYENVFDHGHDKYTKAVETAKNLLLDGYCLNIGLSGKDSSAVSVCIVEGLRLAKIINPHVGPVYFVTTNTTLDNIVLHQYMMKLHEDLRTYGKKYDLPIYTKELKPSIASQPLVEYIGKGKLMHTPQTSVNGRSCAVMWKIKPMENHLTELSKELQSDKLISITGSRTSESAVRAKNLELRQESSTKMVKTGLGWSLALIKDWSLSEVWNLFRIIENGDIESYSDNFEEMRKHYSAGNAGTCDLFAGDNSKVSKSCGSRFGCMTCAMSGSSDKSLEAQIDTDPKTYGFMKPINELREYMINTLFDYKYRSLLGKKMFNGYIKYGVNQYNMKFRMNLLRYVLTIQNEAYATTGNHIIDLIDYEQILAIQYYWSKEGLEPSPGMALKIWNEIIENDEGGYPIPKTVKAEQPHSPRYTYFPLQDYITKENNVGLDDDNFFDKNRNLARVYQKDGSSKRVVNYVEAKKLTVDIKDGKAMMFVTSFYPSLVEDGLLDNKCPTVMLKYLLLSEVIKITKGSIARIDSDMKRAQTLNSIQYITNLTTEEFISTLSISEAMMDANVRAFNVNDKPTGQQQLF